MVIQKYFNFFIEFLDVILYTYEIVQWWFLERKQGKESRSNLGFVMMTTLRVDEFVYSKPKEEEHNKFDNYKSFKG